MCDGRLDIYVVTSESLNLVLLNAIDGVKHDILES